VSGDPCGLVNTAVDVMEVVTKVIITNGQPQHLQSDNGPEFIAYEIKDWLSCLNIRTIYITNGSLWEQAHINIFGGIVAARIIVEQWRKEYNQQRHRS
jgi:putative transposase